MFLALLREPRAEGATRIPPGALGRVLGLDRAPEVKTIRRKLAELATAGKAEDLIMALARHHARAEPQALGFLYVDGHARAYYGTRTVQKTHVARLKFPAPATPETWVTDSRGDPVFMVVAEPSQSLAGELKGLLPELRAIVGKDRRVTVCFDRGGWSPALFADILDAGFGILTYRKGRITDLPSAAFTNVACTDDRGREHEYGLADTMVTLDITDGPRKGEQVSLRQVTRHGKHRQVHTLTSRTDLAAAEVCWRCRRGGGRRTTSVTPAPTSPSTRSTPTPPPPTTRAGWCPTRRKKLRPRGSGRPEPPPARRKPLVTPRCSGCAPPPQDRP